MRGLRFIFFGLALTLLSSCAQQKRVHRPGYHFEWPGKPSKTQTSVSTQKPVVKPELPRAESGTTAVTTGAIAAVEYRPAPVFTGSRTYIDECDTIVLRNEAEIRARVYLVTETEIKYKFCNNTSGPMMVVSKEDVLMIRYGNGRQEIFTRANSDVIDVILEKNIRKAAKTSLWSGLGAYAISLVPIPGLIAGIILAIVAVTSGSRAQRLIDDNPRLDALYGRNARSGTILGIVYLCLVLFVILLAVLLLALYI